MNMIETLKDGVTILAIEGEIGIDNNHVLKPKLQGFIDTGRTTVIIDFSGVTFLDSSSLGTLLVFAKKLEKVDGRLCLCAFSDPVEAVFTMVGFSQFFDIHPNTTEALASLS